ncbi:hypothetical protein DIS24_g1293 [Lasiodiplodia hormozganensis]|uniref:Uncharacterized protein n=1 Tax=Lasiodiplodia hormozganensis TaxID=869390 RepID=A0AA40D576_9PEZI|nr:hypothetical protein DIS24_g1293 [Lasiodiplodia hormozganensis]
MGDDGNLTLAHQLSLSAKDGNPENGIEQRQHVFKFTGGALPWQMAPFKDKVTPNGPSAPDNKTDKGTASKADNETKSAKPRVLFLRLNGPDDDDDDYFFQRTTRRLVGFLQSYAQVDSAFTAGETLEYLNNYKPQAIIVADAALTIRNADDERYIPACGIIMDKIKQFIMDGGNVVFGCNFSDAAFVDFLPFFSTHFDRPWIWQAYKRCVVEYHAAAVEHFPANNFLKTKYNTKNHFLGRVDATEALYKDPQDERLTAVAWAKFGEGHFGWVGDQNKELANDECVFAMCGFSHLHPELDLWYPDTSISLTSRPDGTGFQVSNR